jgi:hypothetical protein
MDAKTKRLVGAAIGLIALGLIGYFIYQKFIAAGDEPPIRVKKGSMEVEILANGGEEWKDETGGKWGLQSAATNARTEYVVRLKASGFVCTPESQPEPPSTTAMATIEYSDSNRLLVQHVGLPTKLHFLPRNAQRDSVNVKLLKYSAETDDDSRFVQSIRFQGTGQPTTCTFTQGQFELLCLCADTSDCQKPECQ